MSRIIIQSTRYRIKIDRNNTYYHHQSMKLELKYVDSIYSIKRAKVKKNEIDFHYVKYTKIRSIHKHMKKKNKKLQTKCFLL